MHIAALTEDAGGRVNLGGLSLEAASAGVEITLITLDDLGLDRLDLIKIDVEGMEPLVLAGASATIERCRPVVFAECNSVEIGGAMLGAFAHTDYMIFGASYPAFNPRNFRQNGINIYDANGECALLFIPEERAAEYDLRGLVAVESLDSLVGLLLTKPQYMSEVLPELARSEPITAATGQLHTPLIAKEIPLAAPRGRPIHVVVPFYRNEGLVDVVGTSLHAVADELSALDATVYFYNDSPDYPPLSEALDTITMRWEPDRLRVVTNRENLGFVGTCNLAFAEAVRAGADVILINSDTKVFPGALREMATVGAIDPMIGFVCPRSNNATLATLPHSSLGEEKTPAEAYSDFLALSPLLPRFNFTPTAVGFALWINGDVIAELGGFDTAYGMGYNEENDLVMRANRCGYRAALANQAFIWHEGERSFSVTSTARAEREATNGRILCERYPEYNTLVGRYFQSPAYRAEDLLETLVDEGEGLRIALDFSSFGTHHNGTFESGLKFLAAAEAVWPAAFRLAAYMSAQAWDFHRMGRFSRVQRLDPDGDERSAAIVRIGQPFQRRDIERLCSLAPVVGVFMLDTISWDCGYLSLDFNHDIWRFVFDEADIVFTNSAYTLDRIRERFHIGGDVQTVVSRHSLDASEYLSDAAQKPAAHAAMPGSLEPHIFVIGNQYAHKFVKPTVDVLAKAFPSRAIVTVGYPISPENPANVQAHSAGLISDADFERFYADASVVVFPSHYEGFGFPVLHALARRKPVFVRETELNHELASRISQARNIHFYRTTAELVIALQTPPRWSEELVGGEADGWKRSAGEVFSALEEALQKTRAARIAQRLQRLDGTALPPVVQAPILSTGRRIALRFGPAIDWVLRIPGLHRAVHWAALTRRRLMHADR
jgi:GT2 family glycosyltransferase